MQRPRATFERSNRRLLKTNVPEGNLHLAIQIKGDLDRQDLVDDRLDRFVIGLGVVGADLPRSQISLETLVRNLTKTFRNILLQQNLIDTGRQEGGMFVVSNSMIVIPFVF